MKARSRVWVMTASLTVVPAYDQLCEGQCLASKKYNYGDCVDQLHFTEKCHQESCSTRVEICWLKKISFKHVQDIFYIWFRTISCKCLVSHLSKTNGIRHWSQDNTFHTVCIRKRLVKWPLWEDLFPHSWQQKVFSSLCSSVSCQIAGMGESFLHTWQQQGFSPVCVRMCLAKLLSASNIFSHTWQQYRFCLCLDKLLASENF